MKDESSFFVIGESEIDKFHNRGINYLDNKEYEKAIEMFTKEIESDPKGFCGYYDIGNVYKETGDLKQAKEYYEKALSNAEIMYTATPPMIDRPIIEMIKKDLESLGGI